VIYNILQQLLLFLLPVVQLSGSHDVAFVNVD